MIYTCLHACVLVRNNVLLFTCDNEALLVHWDALAIRDGLIQLAHGGLRGDVRQCDGLAGECFHEQRHRGCGCGCGLFRGKKKN